jgi:hypothetical protein
MVTRGEYRILLSCEVKKKEENYTVFYFADFFLYIYEVFTSPEKEKSSTNRSRGCDGFYFQPKRKLNQTKQIGKYIFMENIFHRQGSNSHPEGLRQC